MSLWSQALISKKMQIDKHFIKVFNKVSCDEQKLIIFLGCFSIIFYSIIILIFNSAFAGSKFDSQLYIKMYNHVAEDRKFIPLHEYQVSSSPIYVHIMGFIFLIFGKFSELIGHSIYVLMALLSVYFIEKLINPINLKTKILITLLFFGSGYFIAPMLFLTSDMPTIFALSCSVYFFECNRRILLAISSFVLVSVRQSFIWLLLVFIVLEILNLRRTRTQSCFKCLLVYTPSFISLFITYLYFEQSLAPSNYTEAQPRNVFSIPNYFSVVQIGLSSLIVFIPFILQKSSKIRFNFFSALFLLFFSLLSFLSFFTQGNINIQEGFGFISLLHLKMHLSLIYLPILATIGFFLLLNSFDVVINQDNRITFVYILFYVVSSLLIPIPFLRYFQIPFYFALILVFRHTKKDLTNRSKRITFLSYFYITIFNIVSIAL